MEERSSNFDRRLDDFDQKLEEVNLGVVALRTALLTGNGHPSYATRQELLEAEVKAIKDERELQKSARTRAVWGAICALVVGVMLSAVAAIGALGCCVYVFVQKGGP